MIDEATPTDHEVRQSLLAAEKRPGKAAAFLNLMATNVQAGAARDGPETRLSILYLYRAHACPIAPQLVGEKRKLTPCC